MVYWVTAWVLMTFHGSLTYSEPVKTEADCKRMLKFIEDKTLARAQCVEVTVMRKAV